MQGTSMEEEPSCATCLYGSRFANDIPCRSCKWGGGSVIGPSEYIAECSQNTELNTIIEATGVIEALTTKTIKLEERLAKLEERLAKLEESKPIKILCPYESK
jgi:hypothetical protein